MDEDQLHFKRKWSEIRDAALHVVLLTRRSEGFWALPTVDTELGDTYSVAGTPEEKIRNGDKFGSPSITVSYNALCGLTDALGSRSRAIAAQTLAKIEDHRGKHGGYGSLVPRMHQRIVNAVPRHTAMAIIAQLEFGSGDAASAVQRHLEPSIHWLLDNQLKSGGWPYDRTNPQPVLGFISTASSICAIQMFLDKFGPIDRKTNSKARSAIALAVAALTNNQRDGVWNGDNDGSPPDKQVRDVAFALRLLLKANLNSHNSDASINITSMVERFSAIALEDGWPNAVTSHQKNIAASASGLAVLIDSKNCVGMPPEKVRLIEKGIIDCWGAGEAPPHLAAWDWQCLLFLSNKLSAPLSDSQALMIQRNCERIRTKWLSGKLTDRDVSKLTEKIRDVIVFSLTEGEGFKSDSSRTRAAKTMTWLTKKVTERLIVQGVIALLSLFVAVTIFGVDPIEYLKKLLSR